MASPALVSLEAAYAKAALPMLSVAPRRPGVVVCVRGAPTMFGDTAGERFALGVFLYVGGELVWADERRGLDYAHAADVRVPPASAPTEPGVLFIYAAREASLGGAPVRRKRYEETWVFIGSEGGEDIAVSVPAVPFIGSGKRVVDNHYYCFPGIRVVPDEWRTVAFVINPYPEAVQTRAWVQTPAGERHDVRPASPLGPRAVCEIDLAAEAMTAGLAQAERLDLGTLVVWASLKPQGYVAIEDGRGRTRAMDHLHPFWQR